jgi:hypothetical protein
VLLKDMALARRSWIGAIGILCLPILLLGLLLVVQHLVDQVGLGVPLAVHLWKLLEHAFTEFRANATRSQAQQQGSAAWQAHNLHGVDDVLCAGAEWS